MRHDRVTGTLREDLEMAQLEMESDPKRRPNKWGVVLPYPTDYALRWNVWPEAFREYLKYQSEEAWRDAFVKGRV